MISRSRKKLVDATLSVLYWIALRSNRAPDPGLKELADSTRGDIYERQIDVEDEGFTFFYRAHNAAFVL